jgi:filamentous haemagglutinin family N-terminal domain
MKPKDWVGAVQGGFMGVWAMAGLVVSSALIKAEVTLDGTLGPASALQGPDYLISPEIGQQVGGNLFHSFGLFNLNASESATFTGPDSIENILGRVTGGMASHIDGLVRSTIPDANLFLLNPSGVLFGPNAQLDVQGSFHVSTADFIRLADGVRFNAMPSAEDALLTTAPPEAFGFLGEKQPASITFVGDLSKGGTELWVPKGKTFSVIGGNIQTQYTLLGAETGEVNLVSVASAGEVGLEQEGLDTSSFSRLGEIKLQTSGITASGDSGGRIFIRGGQLVMQNATIWSDTDTMSGRSIDIAVTDRLTMEGGQIYTTAYGTGSGGNIAITTPHLHLTSVAQIRTETQGPGRGGDLAVEAEDILLEGHIPIEDEYTIGSGLVTVTGGSGHGGNIQVKTKRLQVRDGAAISSENYGSGKGGDLTLEADDILLEGHIKDSEGKKIIGNSGLFAIAFGLDPNELGIRRSGDGGNIQVKTKQLKIRDGAQISTDTLGAGNSGKLMVEANHIALEDPNTVIQAASDLGWWEGKPNEPEHGLVYGGDAGEIEIKTKRLELKKGAQISTHTLGPGKAGKVIVEADDILLEGRSEDGTISGLFATAGGEGPNEAGRVLSGDGGSIHVKARQLEVKKGAAIAANTDGSGRGGNVTVEVDSIALEDADTAIDTLAAKGKGDAGNIEIKAGTLQVRNGAQISATTVEEGGGGTLTLTAKDIDLSNGGSISAASFGTGESGSISITALNDLRLVNGSQISVATTHANAGDIDLKVGKLLHLRESSRITTSVAGGQGDGGNITLDPPFVVLDGASKIIAQAKQGRGGNIHITTDFLFRSPESVIDASSEFGVSGTVEIDSPDTDITGGLAELPTNFLDAAAILTKPCAERLGMEVSRLVVRPYEVLPDSPYALRVRLPKVLPGATDWTSSERDTPFTPGHSPLALTCPDDG